MTDNPMFGPQPIPSFLESLTSLKHLSMRLTTRTGIIPDWFAKKLTHLSILDLDSNNLSGTIPTEFGAMFLMEHLMLNRNQFTGTIPSQLSDLADLSTLMLDGNQLVGSIEACQVEDMITDCGVADQDSNYTAIDCECCSACCTKGDGSCNMGSWLPSFATDLQGSYNSETFRYMSVN